MVCDQSSHWYIDCACLRVGRGGFGTRSYNTVTGSLLLHDTGQWPRHTGVNDICWRTQLKPENVEKTLVGVVETTRSMHPLPRAM